MNKLIKFCLLFLGLFVLYSSTSSTVVQAATNNKVLLVYDSQNNVNNSAKNIDALQRILTSMNLRVKTIEQSDYKAGDLNQSYLGVITMVNWREVGLTNRQFIQDRDKYSGIKLHIGQNISATEVKELGGKSHKLYRQQFALKDNDNVQTLPFSETITVLDELPAEAKTIGTLTTQQADEKSYPFGIINGKFGYLPSFRPNGLSLMAEIQVIGQLFDRVGTYKPLLTFTNVTPYSNLRIIDELSLFCYKNEIPFAISTTSVSQNTDLKAFDRFTDTMRNVESRGGIIFLNAPEVSSADNSGEILNQKFATYITSLAQHRVFPAGLSSPGYWNQDQTLRNNFLNFGDHWLMLPNQIETSHVKQDNNAQIATESFFAMPMSSLKEVRKNGALHFAIPTALTISLPDKNTHVEMLEKEIDRMQLNWYDPVADNLSTKIETPSTLLQYKHGDYYANGKYEEVQISNSSLNKQFNDGKPKAAMSGYFKVQGHVFMIFFIIVTIILGIFIYLGQKVYWNRLRRK